MNPPWTEGQRRRGGGRPRGEWGTDFGGFLDFTPLQGVGCQLAGALWGQIETSEVEIWLAIGLQVPYFALVPSGRAGGAEMGRDGAILIWSKMGCIQGCHGVRRGRGGVLGSSGGGS